MDRGFQEGLLGNASEGVTRVLTANPEAVQTGMLVGTLFRVMSVEGDEVLVNEKLLKHFPSR